MKTKSSQKGLSALGILVVLLLIGFFATAVVKIFPIYMESWSINGAITTAIQESKLGTTPRELRSKIDKLFNVNQINAIKSKDIKFTKKKGGKLVVDATYEQRVHFMKNIDVVVKFDEFIYEVQGR